MPLPIQAAARLDLADYRHLSRSVLYIFCREAIWLAFLNAGSARVQNDFADIRFTNSANRLKKASFLFPG
jgi:hypothetical protein